MTVIVPSGTNVLSVIDFKTMDLMMRCVNYAISYTSIFDAQEQETLAGIMDRVSHIRSTVYHQAKLQNNHQLLFALDAIILCPTCEGMSNQDTEYGECLECNCVGLAPNPAFKIPVQHPLCGIHLTPNPYCALCDPGSPSLKVPVSTPSDGPIMPIPDTEPGW